MIVVASFFLFMYHTRESDLFADWMQAQRIYVVTEYVLAILCLAYSPTYFWEIRRHFAPRHG